MSSDTVENFRPILAPVYERVWDSPLDYHAEARELNESIMRAFLNASTNDSPSSLRERFLAVVDTGCDPRILSERDFARLFRDEHLLLGLALGAREAARNKKSVGERGLEAFGIAVFDLGKAEIKALKEAQNERQSCIDQFGEGVSSQFQVRGFRHADRIGERGFFATLYVDVESPHCAKYLEEACKRASAVWKCQVEVLPTKIVLKVVLGIFPSSNKGRKLCLEALSDALFDLHLTGMMTRCIDGEEWRSADCGLTSLWWEALDSIRDGRLGRCSVCGKPFIAKRERGKKRKYCSNACKQRNKKRLSELRAR